VVFGQKNSSPEGLLKKTDFSEEKVFFWGGGGSANFTGSLRGLIRLCISTTLKFPVTDWDMSIPKKVFTQAGLGEFQIFFALLFNMLVRKNRFFLISLPTLRINKILSE